MFTAHFRRRPRSGASSGALSTCVAVVVMLAPLLQAQPASTPRIDPRWHAFIGCWAASTDGVRGADLCIVPTNDSATVELITVAGDSIISRTGVAATGTRVMRSRSGCSGWDNSRWSTDDRRWYVRSEYTCADSTVQNSSAIFDMTTLNSFTRVDVARAGAASVHRVTRYSARYDSLGIPTDIFRRVQPSDWKVVAAARWNNVAQLTTADVADASNALDPAVIEAWLDDRAQLFVLTPDAVRALRDVAVPSSVIDRMMARSHRTLFVSESIGKRFARWLVTPSGPASAYQPIQSPFFRGVRNSLSRDQPGELLSKSLAVPLIISTPFLKSVSEIRW